MTFLPAIKVLAPYSFRGAVKVYNYCDSVEFLKDIREYYDGDDIYVKSELKISGKNIVMSFENTDSAKLIGKTLSFKKEDISLPDRCYFNDDIIGLPVYDSGTGGKYGVLTSVTTNGVQDIFTIADGKKEYLVPNVSAFIKRIIPGDGIYISPIEGMFE